MECIQCTFVCVLPLYFITSFSYQSPCCTVAALSTQLSTAALDKHPQSKERGITLDLGFSSFTIPLPAGYEALQCKELQVTLVDCPGHASLVRTILGGAQIMDVMLLVVDVTKGIQVNCSHFLFASGFDQECRRELTRRKK